MKKLKFLIIFVFLIFWNYLAFADLIDPYDNYSSNQKIQTIEDLELKISDSKILIDDTFSLTIDLNLWDNAQAWDLTIAWLENFVQNWTSRSVQSYYQNWVWYTIYWISVNLMPKTEWTFTIWPAMIQVWNEIHTSNTVEITVESVANMLNSQNDSNDFEDENSEKSENSEDSSIDSQNSSSDENSEFNPNAWQKNLSLMFLYVFLAIILILIIIYFLVKNKKSEIPEKIEKVPEISTKKYFLDKLKNIQKKDLDSQEFCAEINNFTREIFSKSWVEKAETLTLKELQKNKNANSSLLESLKKTYYFEFNNQNFESSKDEIFSEIKKIINEIF